MLVVALITAPCAEIAATPAFAIVSTDVVIVFETVNVTIDEVA